MLCFSLLVITLDNTILNVALPTIVRDLKATNSQLQWMVDSYTLVFASLLLTAGTLGDRLGRRGALVVGLAIFGIGSLLSASATDPAQLIATRALMGIGGAAIMPATLSMTAPYSRNRVTAPPSARSAFRAPQLTAQHRTTSLSLPTADDVGGGVGGGTGETRNWIMAQAIADRPGVVVDYVPVFASPCGMGFAYWEM